MSAIFRQNPSIKACGGWNISLVVERKFHLVPFSHTTFAKVIPQIWQNEGKIRKSLVVWTLSLTPKNVVKATTISKHNISHHQLIHYYRGWGFGGVTSKWVLQHAAWSLPTLISKDTRTTQSNRRHGTVSTHPQYVGGMDFFLPNLLKFLDVSRDALSCSLVHLHI